jgi:protein-tyrosine-phosphatase
MAEGILRKRLADDQQRLSAVAVSSMGIHGLDHQPAAEFAQLVCSEHGIDISSHRSRSLVFDELKEASFVFAMEPVQVDFVQLFFPGFREKVFLLGSWPGRASRKGIVKDPIGGNMRAYHKAFDAIDAHIDRILAPLTMSLANQGRE